MERSGCQSEEKEQQSPVSVMDFPYGDEEESSSPSPSFQQSLANIESKCLLCSLSLSILRIWFLSTVLVDGRQLLLC